MKQSIPKQKDLEKQIKDAQHAYYVESKPIMTDPDFDALYNLLEKYYPTSKLLVSVGSDLISGWEKRRHVIKMGSQNKAHTENDLQHWIKNNNITFPLLVQHKLDGLALELIYEKGELVSAITRGDGDIGDDVTRNVRMIPNVPKTLEVPVDVAVRGEVCMSVDVFYSKYSKEFENPRNVASGFLKAHDSNKSKDLEFLAYNLEIVIPSKNIQKPVTEGDIHILLFYLRFEQPITNKVEDFEKLINYLKNIEDKRDELEFKIDGCVLKSVYIDVEDMKRNKPKKQIAWKFPPQEKDSTLRRVDWSVSGETITPIAIFDSVWLDGSNVSKASLVNQNEIRRLNLSLTDKVTVVKRGDIIPKVISVKYKSPTPVNIKPPAKCPVCNGEVTSDASSRLICTNILCKAKAHQRIDKWVRKLGVKGFGTKMIDFMIDAGLLNQISDLYKQEFKVQALLKTNLKKNTEKAINNLYSVTEVSLPVFIAGFNIRSFGERQTKKLVDSGFNTFDELINITPSDFVAVDGMGTALYDLFRSNIDTLKAEMIEVQKHIRIALPDTSKKSKLDYSIAITGKLNNITRKELSSKIEKAGWRVSSSVTGKVDFLVNNDKESTSSKNKKANSLSVPIIDENEILKLLKDETV